jgi:hypothetical protein
METHPNHLSRYLLALAGCLAMASCVTESGEGAPGAPEELPVALLGQGLERGDDSATVTVKYGASGGTITSRGLYTAGPHAGSYHVVAAIQGVADTAVVTMTAPPSPLQPAPPAPPAAANPSATPAPPAARASGEVGVPMGMSGLFTAGGNPGRFNMSLDGYNADNIVARLETARRRKLRLLLNLTGGNHNNYKTNGVFDITKWMAKMQTFNTVYIQAAIAAGVADGIIIGNSVMDEPHNDSPQASWGPPGTMTKSRVDDMCRYVKAIFPTLPVGVVHNHLVFEPERGYSSCDFIVSQYAYRKTKGDVKAFRDGGLAFAARNHMAIIFSLNVLDGGIPRKASGTCGIPVTGGPGTYGRNCRMTPEQIRDFGLILGPAGCALNMWRYDREFFNNSANKASFAEVADSLAKVPSKVCRRQ